MDPLRHPPTTARPLLRHLLLLLSALALIALAAETRAEQRDADPVRAMARAARPLADLRHLERAVGAATVVGVGEATHGSSEFFTAKHRLFRHLVEHCGFTTYALEANWSTGLRLNDYVLHGRGDPRTLMREEFQESYLIWHTREHLDLIRWMRRHNLRHPERPVQFMGNDLAYAGPRLFDAVTAHVARHHPRLLPEVERRYRASRPTGGVHETIKARLALPLGERRAMARDVRAVLDLLERRHTGADARRHAFVLHHARAIVQNATEFAYDLDDPGQVGEAMRYRDRIMAENTLWWQRQTGHRILVSAHNGHIRLKTSDPAHHPVVQGTYLREAIGADYVAVGFTFGRGSFNALDLTDPGESLGTFRVGPPAPGSHEHTLERVSPRDYVLDLRTAPAAARDWLAVERPARDIGNAWPAEPVPLRLLGSYDVLVHLHRVRAAHRL
ncbi:erythromycin esterase family protein [Streptomyces sp. C10-9-1]|uniref:erythromycin esterase family protein n=1 Tax=Streptomyces sp. C10-9-1 TaxID=1859285 RepID=UPI003F4A3760